MPVGRLFRLLFVPTITGFIFNAMLNLADGMFVGHGVGSDGLAAINIVAPIFLISTGIGLMFGIGASVRCSILLARGERSKACAEMTQAFMVSAIIASSVIALCAIFPDTVLDIFGCSERLRPYASDYLFYLLPGCLLLMVQCVGMMLIRLDGSPRYAMMCNIIPATANIILDWLFVFPFGWGIAGAAAATSIGTSMGGLMVIFYFIRFSGSLRFSHAGKASRILRNAASQMTLGVSAFLGEIAIAVMMLTGNYVFISYLGEDGVAAFSVCCYLLPMVFMINNAVAQSAQPIISFNYGRRNTERVRRALAISSGVGLAAGLLATAGLKCAARPIVAMFLDSSGSASAYSLAAAGVPAFGLCAPAFGLNLAFIGFFQSIEQAWRATTYTLLRGIIFPVPAFVLLPLLLGPDGIWLAIPLAEFLTLAVIAADLAVNHRKLFEVTSQNDEKSIKRTEKSDGSFAI